MIQISNFRDYKKVLLERGIVPSLNKYRHQAVVTVTSGALWWKKREDFEVFNDGHFWYWGDTGRSCISYSPFTSSVADLARAYAAKHEIPDIPS